MKQSKVFVLIAVFFVIALFACSKNNSSQNSKVAENKAMKIGLVTDLGGINDHSFNQLSYEGLKALHKMNPNISISYLESKSFADYNLNIETYVNEGCDLIIGVGATFIETIKEASKNYPNQKFMINGVTIGEDRPNVACLVFANEEAGYLAGVTAAMKTQTNTIGYIQGMETEVLNLFGIGYVQGAKSINKDVKILMYNANNFADITGGNVAATNMIKNKADVIYQMAGATGIGVINACADNKVFAIGSDTDQSVISKDAVLLSVLQYVDRAVVDYILDMIDNGFKSGIILNNIKNDKIDLAYNDTILPKEIKDKLESVKKDIADKKISISQNAKDCPEFSFTK